MSAKGEFDQPRSVWCGRGTRNELFLNRFGLQFLYVDPMVDCYLWRFLGIKQIDCFPQVIGCYPDVSFSDLQATFFQGIQDYPWQSPGS